MERSEVINLKDIHEEQAEDLGIEAGVSNFNVIIKSHKWTLFTEIELLTPLKDKRGVHMSRLILPAMVECESVEQFIDQTKKSIFEKVKDYPYIKVRFKFPWRDQFPTIIVENYTSVLNTYTYVLKGATACPCSRANIGIGHMQKCRLIVTFTNGAPYPKFEDIFLLLDKCFSSPLSEKLKRNEESAMIMNAQDNAKFVEDVVRDAIHFIPLLEYARAESDESIHSHKAIAEWWKK
jgi:GTP cyclohydrolase FolE2